MIGTTVDGKYQIARQLGEGGMGAVYEARHLGTGRRVAVKVVLGESLTKNPDVIARFQREARAAGAIESQHIAQVLDFGTDRETGHPYMVIEYLAGEDVQSAIHRLGAIEPALALRIAAQTCTGLQRAHAAGVVHRDIKPANLFLARQDAGAVVVKLLDFGIAKVKMEQFATMDRSLTRTGSMLGSPLYMSPEQAHGAKDIDPRTDLWSLGVVLYEALSGTSPYGHCETIGSLILAICAEDPRPLRAVAPWVPPEVSAIVERAVRRDRSERYPNASTMLEDVHKLLPQGYAIHESMFVAAPPERRATPEPAAEATPSSEISGVESTLPAGDVLSPPQGIRTTGAGLASSRMIASKPRRRSAPLVVAVAVAVTATAGWEVYRFGSDQHQRVNAPTAASISVAPSAAPPSSPVAAPATAPSSPQSRTVFVATPPGAGVEVDGAPSAAIDGGVEIAGAVGSVHHVRVFKGRNESRADIVVAESGAVPARLELAIVGPHASTLGPRPISNAKPAGEAPKPPPSSAAAAAPTPTGIDRGFN